MGRISALKRENILDDTHIFLQIHDELVYEIADGVLDKATEIIKKAMEEVLPRSFLNYQTKIPLLVHYGIGENLGKVK